MMPLPPTHQKIASLVREWDAARRSNAADQQNPLVLDHQLRERHAAAVNERDRLATAPPPVDEVVANVRALINERAARWREEHGAAITREGAGCVVLQTNGTRRVKRPALYDLRFQPTFGDLCGLFPEAITQAYEQAIREQRYEAGPPMMERQQALARAEDEIGAIEAQHTALVDACAALDPPVVLQLLESERVRRDAEALKARRAERARREREEQEALLDQQMGKRPRATRSPALDAGGPPNA